MLKHLTLDTSLSGDGVFFLFFFGRLRINSYLCPNFCHAVAVAANSGGRAVKRHRGVGIKARGRSYT